MAKLDESLVGSKNDQQLDFFAPVNSEPEVPKYLQSLEDELHGIDVMNMTPLQAISKLHDLTESVKNIQ